MLIYMCVCIKFLFMSMYVCIKFPKGEFYYDGISNIDNHSKYDNIRVYM